MSTFEITDNIKIQTRCMESNPCKHHVQINREKGVLMSGVTIYEMLNAKSLPIPDHFMCYKDWKNPFSFPAKNT